MQIYKRLLTLTLVLVALIALSGCNIFNPQFDDNENLYYTIVIETEVGGSVTGAGAYVPNSEVTVVATPSQGYFFVNWTNGATEVSTNTTHTFNASENLVLQANFASLVGSYIETRQNDIIVYEFLDTNNFKISTYLQQTEYTNIYYDLTEITGTYTLDQNQLTLNPDSSQTQILDYTYNTNTHTLTAEDSEGLITVLNKNLSPVPNIYYNFINYDEPTTEIEFFSDNTALVKISELNSEPVTVNYEYKILNDYIILTDILDNEITIHQYLYSQDILSFDGKLFYKEGMTLEFAVTASSIDAQYINGLGTYYLDETVTLTILQRPGYTFNGWKVSGQFVSTSNSYTFVIKRNAVITVLWKAGDNTVEPA